MRCEHCGMQPRTFVHATTPNPAYAELQADAAQRKKAGIVLNPVKIGGYREKETP